MVPPRFSAQPSVTTIDCRASAVGPKSEVAAIANDKVIVDQRVQVTMTWLEAKVLADFLNANIKALEELNGGPLKLQKNLDKIIVPDTFQSMAR